MNKMTMKLMGWLIVTACSFLPLTLQAQDQSISGNLAVSGTIDMSGNGLYLGTHTGGMPGWMMGYTDGSTSAVNFNAASSANRWQWQQGAAGTLTLQMSLSGSNTLTLFDQSSTPVAKITLNPLGTSTFANSVTVTGTLTANGNNNQMPNQTLTGGSSVLTEGLADGRYLSNAPSSLALFPGASATGNNSMALGSYVTASGPYSTALGDATTASGTYSLASGVSTVASGAYSEAFGNESAATQTGAFASGTSSAIGNNSTAMGLGSASGYVSAAIGCGANASGTNAVALGSFTSSPGDYATAVGAATTAFGGATTAMGASTLAYGMYSTATGLQTSTYATASTTMGIGTTAGTYASVAMGQFNVGVGDPNSWVPTDPLLELGNGTDATHLSNALTVYKNGDATHQGTVTAPKFVTTTAAGDIPMFGH